MRSHRNEYLLLRCWWSGAVNNITDSSQYTLYHYIYIKFALSDAGKIYIRSTYISSLRLNFWIVRLMWAFNSNLCGNDSPSYKLLWLVEMYARLNDIRAQRPSSKMDKDFTAPTCSTSSRHQNQTKTLDIPYGNHSGRWCGLHCLSEPPAISSHLPSCY